MTLGRLRLSVADARDLAEGALRGIGYHNDEARIIADHIIDAAMCGYEYSGLAKILNVFESEHFRVPRRSMKVLRETEVSLAFDGGNNVGMLALFQCGASDDQENCDPRHCARFGDRRLDERARCLLC
jgi:LDH2 family malate/lactate/ureidoglycolate dehydrogenase